MRNSHFARKLVAIAALALSCYLRAQGNSDQAVIEFERSCVNQKMLMAVLRADTISALNAISGLMELADEDVQRLYFTKLYDMKPSAETATRLLKLMPNGRLASLQFYTYTMLYDEKPGARNWIKEKEAEQVSDLYNEYYDLLRQLLPRYPTYLNRYLVTLRWLSDNADMGEAIWDWEPSLRKAFGKRYDEEKRRVWGILERPYDPPS
jgi:hypothetical protein